MEANLNDELLLQFYDESLQYFKKHSLETHQTLDNLYEECHVNTNFQDTVGLLAEIEFILSEIQNRLDNIPTFEKEFFKFITHLDNKDHEYDDVVEQVNKITKKIVIELELIKKECHNMISVLGWFHTVSVGVSPPISRNLNNSIKSIFVRSSLKIAIVDKNLHNPPTNNTTQQRPTVFSRYFYVQETSTTTNLLVLHLPITKLPPTTTSTSLDFFSRFTKQLGFHKATLALIVVGLADFFF
ncbi:hypothetical protein DFA_11066 [Cavenderia fasciculata]|uniref:Uncharacterized protein n=1 Tax=Cavenderia fasciculata TaxID=261658 RepID=F4QEP4_CACFS|nr:uncharacterized protein DFA_11066 [Cavenderia fasciculata]EGG13305.1 hypothetical protein DFA_11066 [Cavenderia fasciculata]|eukprot:XP_004350004.1 hypothetical protein DFA_11066 [Cavenderia fasciculata]